MFGRSREMVEYFGEYGEKIHCDSIRRELTMGRRLSLGELVGADSLLWKDLIEDGWSLFTFGDRIMRNHCGNRH